MKESEKFTCPYCEADIGAEDVNVSTDVALCRSCNRTSAFSSLCEAGKISLSILQTPPKGIRYERGFRGGRSIVYRKISKGIFFLIPFTAVWSGGSMWGIYGSQFREGKLDIGLALFGIPFLIGTFVLVGMILYGLFGKWKVTLERGQVEVATGIGPIAWERSIPYHSDSRVSMKAAEFKNSDQIQKAISVETDGKEMLFGTGIPEDAQQFIAAAVLEEIRNR